MRTTHILIILCSCLALFACTAPAYVYAPAKITTHKGKLHIQPTSKFKPMPDTTVYGFIIKRGGARD